MKVKPIPPITEKQRVRFWSRVDRSGDCWRWTGAKTGREYGIVCLGGTAADKYAAHRIAYVLSKNPIPENMDIHHTCDNHWCVNPDHLQAVTRHDHLIISYREQGKRSRKVRTHCRKGHEFTDDNTYTFANKKNGGVVRRCKQCMSDNNKQFFKRNKDYYILRRIKRKAKQSEIH